MIAPGRRVGLAHRFALRGRPVRSEEVSVVLPPPSRPLCNHQELATARRLVVRRDAGLGDCLMILPTVEAIKRRYPRLQITFQVPAPYTELLGRFEVVDEAVPLDATGPSRTPDIVFVDLSNYMERHPLTWSTPRIDLVGTAFGIQPLPHAARYDPAPAQQHAAGEWLAHQACTTCPRLGIVLRGIYGHRSWLVPYVFELAAQFTAYHGDVIIFDADPQGPRCLRTANSPGTGTVASAYGLPLPTVAALLAECDVAVVPDTGLLHLAACVQTPLVAIFGAVTPHLRLNHYQYCRCLTAADTVECVPCCEGPQHFRCQYECLQAITPTKVMAAVEELLMADTAAGSVESEEAG